MASQSAIAAKNDREGGEFYLFDRSNFCLQSFVQGGKIAAFGI
jgi:hypothetical protein